MNDYIMKGQFFGMLQEALESVNIYIELDITEHKSTIIPYIGEAHFNGVRGYYFRKAGFGNFLDEEKEKIRKVFSTFTSCKVKPVLHSINDREIDDDRIHFASICFSTETCGVNILLTNDFIDQLLLNEYSKDEIALMNEEDKVDIAGDISLDIIDSNIS